MKKRRKGLYWRHLTGSQLFAAKQLLMRCFVCAKANKMGRTVGCLVFLSCLAMTMKSFCISSRTACVEGRGRRAGSTRVISVCEEELGAERPLRKSAAATGVGLCDAFASLSFASQHALIYFPSITVFKNRLVLPDRRLLGLARHCFILTLLSQGHRPAFQSWEFKAELQCPQLRHKPNPSTVASPKAISLSGTETDPLGARVCTVGSAFSASNA